MLIDTRSIPKARFHWLEKYRATWSGMSLASQFAAVAALVVTIVMTVLGIWVATQIENGVLRNTAASAAIYLDGFVEPVVQDLAHGSELSPASRKELSALFDNVNLNNRIIDLKIWTPDGTIVYSTNSALIGRKFPVTEKLLTALRGNIVPEFDDLEDEENVLERHLDTPLLEIYAPVRERLTDRVIAIAEFYEHANHLADDLSAARIKTGVIVGSLGFLILFSLSGIVGGASRTIENQQATLRQRVGELSTLLARNEKLQHHVANANRRSSETTERFLQRVGAELHDGPAQLVGLALLRLDGLQPLGRGRSSARIRQQARDDLDIVRGALDDALREIRDISSGLALPTLVEKTMSECVEIAIRNHERRSRTSVTAQIANNIPDNISQALKTTAYRFVQEGLNNAYRHADGIGQRVVLAYERGMIEIEVIDEGPGIDNSREGGAGDCLGLPGLRNRVEALGGTMEIINTRSGGTRLRAQLAIDA